MASEGRALVIIGDETYSVLERPSTASQAVTKAKTKMLDTVDLKTLVSELVTVGKFIRIAYNGVAGDTELQIGMRKIGFEVAELCDDSSLVISKFHTAANSVLTDLTGAYEFFLDNMEEMALSVLEAIGQTAKEMEGEANKLYERFSKQRDNVLAACTETATKKGLEEKELERLKQKAAEMKNEQEKQEKEEELAIEEQARLQKEIDASMIEEEKTAEELARAPDAAEVIFGILSFGLYPAIRTNAVGESMRGIQGRIAKLHESRREAIERKRKALKQIASCAIEIERSQDKATNVQEPAIAALHGAVGALTNLAKIMQNTAAFWKRMQVSCEEQAKGKLQSLLRNAKRQEDPAERMKVYMSKIAKVRAIEMYAFWSAMEVVCTEYTEHIKESRQELYRYLSENPTFDESRERIGLLCKEFHMDIAIQDKQLDERLKEMPILPMVKEE